MAGTSQGAKKAAKTNKERYGEDFYRKIGHKGGNINGTGGFASESVGVDGLTGPQRARIAGAKGGALSRRGPSKKGTRITVEKHIDVEFVDD